MVMTRTVYRVSFDPRPIRVNTEAGDGGTSTKSVTFLHCEFGAPPIRVHKEAETWIKRQISLLCQEGIGGEPPFNCLGVGFVLFSVDEQQTEAWL